MSDTFVDPALADPHPDGVDLDSLSDRHKAGWVLGRRFALWAANAQTDMPPDVYAGETRSDGTIAQQNLWLLDGEYVDEDTYAGAQPD